MKKWLWGLALILILSIAGIYILIPGRIIVSAFSAIQCTPNAVFRTLSTEDKWKIWFPQGNRAYNSTQAEAKDKFTYKRDTYQITNKFPNTIELLISEEDGTVIKSSINILQLPENASAIHWQCELVAGLNPISRIFQYVSAQKIKNNMTDLLDYMHSFLEKKENVYGMSIEIASTKDTVLVATKSVLSAYPSTTEIYDLIAVLKNYIAKQKALVTGYPMLNISPLNDNKFEMMVAIPVNRVLEGENNIFPKRMIPGNFVISQIKGGSYTIIQAEKQMELYFQDNSKVAMAIPFQYLITDRVKEPDTSKWITKLYAPVFR